MTGLRLIKTSFHLAGFVFLCLFLPAGSIFAQDDEGKAPAPPVGSDLALADLAPYRAALDGKPAGPATPVTFRDLWDHAETYQGHRVRVQGRVARRFRQGAFGTFPPLIEAWAVTPAGDPFCLVFPDPSQETGGPAASAPGASVGFEGVFLRQVRYPGGDTARRAPLIVGDRPPTVTAALKPRPDPVRGGPAPGVWGGFSRLDWALGIGAAVVAGWVLVFQHLRRPTRCPLRLEEHGEPPPDFVDPS